MTSNKDYEFKIHDTWVSQQDEKIKKDQQDHQNSSGIERLQQKMEDMRGDLYDLKITTAKMIHQLNQILSYLDTLDS